MANTVSVTSLAKCVGRSETSAAPAAVVNARASCAIGLGHRIAPRPTEEQRDRPTGHEVVQQVLTHMQERFAQVFVELVRNIVDLRQLGHRAIVSVDHHHPQSSRREAERLQHRPPEPLEVEVGQDGGLQVRAARIGIRHGLHAAGDQNSVLAGTAVIHS